MNTNQQTEQPIPEEFENWISDWLKENVISEQPAYAGFTPTEQPSHVPDTKGEIPDQIMEWIRAEGRAIENRTYDLFVAAKSMGLAMYRKLQEDGDAFSIFRLAHMLNATKMEIASLTKELERTREKVYEARKETLEKADELIDMTAKRDLAKEGVLKLMAKLDTVEHAKKALIDDLAAKNGEAGEYRKALGKISVAIYPNQAAKNIVDQAMAKYPNT